jgi:hypothetical protein
MKNNNLNNPMTEKDRIELREKILKGITLAVEKLIRSKQKTDGELVYSKDGKIVFIKAKELVK